MTLPTYDQLMLPLMRLLSEQKEAIKISEAAKLLANKSKLSEEELSQKLPSGRNIFNDRVAWAKTYLVKAGLVHQPKRGFCEISELGKAVDFNGLNIINNDFLVQFDGFKQFKYGNKVTRDAVVYSQINENKSAHNTPEELIELASKELNQSIKDELLDKIKSNTPKFFEQLVVDLLVAMGYGGSHQDAAQAIGKTNDGGIDGVISEDRLGLDKIYIQAKRWENTIGRPDIQQFKGALADQVAKKGVFITTSSFSKEAIESAKKSGIVLIDGDKLTSLMIEFGLGIQIERSFHVYKIDQDRFDEDNF